MKTVTFETAKRLYDLGVDISTEERYILKNKSGFEGMIFTSELDDHTDYYTQYIPAPDAQELLDRIVKSFRYGDKCVSFILFSDGELFIPKYFYWEFSDMVCVADIEYKSKLLQERLAELIEWLIENKYTTAEQINKGE